MIGQDLIEIVTTIGYSNSGLNRDHYNINGYNSSGYDRDRYNINGYNARGRNRQGNKRKALKKYTRIRIKNTNSTTNAC